jgi:hypothetical protein
MARNRLAGTSTGTSKSTKYYNDNPEAKAKKNEYNKKYHSTRSRKLYRAALKKKNANNPNSKVGDGKDVSHTRNGYKLKAQGDNRGSKSDMPGDRRARGKKK